MTIGNGEWIARLLALEALERRGLSSREAEDRLITAGMHNDFTLRYGFRVGDDVRVFEEMALRELTMSPAEAVTVSEAPHGP